MELVECINPKSGKPEATHSLNMKTDEQRSYPYTREKTYDPYSSSKSWMTSRLHGTNSSKN